MLGDEAQPAEGDGSRTSAASGPRHAAPRKSLLTKLHMPAGKAVALAAMPTAVLMGMGFTPHLAQADDMPENPFQPGPCVSQPDAPAPSATGTPAKPADPAHKASPKPSATPAPDRTAEPARPKPSPSPSADNPVTGLLPHPDQATTQPSPSASPSPGAAPSTPSGGLLDPLGDLLGGLLGGGTSTASPSPTPRPPAPTTAPPAAPAPKTTAPAKPPAPGSGTTAGNATKDTVKGAGDAARKTLKDPTGATASPKPSNTAPGAPGAAHGKQPFPCPTFDAKALADADVEQGIPLLPDAPWTLHSSKLTLYGAAYHGIVQVRTWNGSVKDVLKFTATAIDIGDLHQIVQGPENTTTHVQARPGSTSTIRDGTVTMYTESVSGNLFGVVPLTFTPKAPPPVTLPFEFFTDARVVQAGQFGGTLHVPGMRVLPNQP